MKDALRTVDDYRRWLGSHEFPEIARVLDNLYAELNGEGLNAGTPGADDNCVISSLREQLRNRRRAAKGANPAVQGDVDAWLLKINGKPHTLHFSKGATAPPEYGEWTWHPLTLAQVQPAEQVGKRQPVAFYGGLRKGFAERLTHLRAKKGWTQKHLAEQLAVGRSMVAMYETERAEPSLLGVVLLSRAFGVSADYLLGLATPAPQQPVSAEAMDAARYRAIVDSLRCLGSHPVWTALCSFLDLMHDFHKSQVDDAIDAALSTPAQQAEPGKGEA